MRTNKEPRRRRSDPTAQGRPEGAGDRLIDILQCFTHDAPRLSPAEISARTGLPRSTTYRLLSRLARRGLVTRDLRSGGFSPGLRLLELGAIASAQVELREIARPLIVELVQRTGETVNLSVYHGGFRVCVDKADSIHDIRGVIHLGRPYPLHAGAAGKAILAFLPDDTISRILRAQKLPSFTSRTQTKPNALRASLEEIRRAGVAITQGERVEGATAVSAPVFDERGAVVGSLTISGPSFRFSAERTRKYRSFVKDAADRLTRAFGGRLPAPGNSAPRPA